MVLEYHLKIWKESVHDILPTNTIVWTNLALFMDSEAKLWLASGTFHQYFKLHLEVSQMKHLLVFLSKGNGNLSKKLVNNEKLMVQQWLWMIFSTIFQSGKCENNYSKLVLDAKVVPYLQGAPDFLLFFSLPKAKFLTNIYFIFQKEIFQFNSGNWRY